MNRKSYQGSQIEAGGCDWKIIEVLKWKVIPGVQNRGILSRFMGSRSHPHRVLSVCVRMCEQVSVGVCD